MSFAFVVACSLVLAQSGPPPTLALPGKFVLHLRVSEELDPDRLGALAAPEVVLWVETRSNGLPTGFLERLPGFSEVYVQMRAPIRGVDLEQLARAPRAGVWLSPEDAVRARGSLGTRPCALALRGELTEAAFAQALSARPRRVTWAPGREGISLGEWALWWQLPGRSGVEVGRGPGRRVVILPSIPAARLAELFARDPAVQLEVRVGANFQAAVETAALLRELEGAERGR